LFTLTFGREIEDLAHGRGELKNLSELKNSTEHSAHYLRSLTSEDVLEHPIPVVYNESLADSINGDQPTSDNNHPEPIRQPEPTPIIHDEYILNFSLREILLFSSVIAATDTVAALTFIKEENEPKLFAILFGEGVINDAVCIVLYGIIRDFTASNEEFTTKTPLRMLGSFMNMFFFSFLVGAAVGCLSSVFLKKLKAVKLNRVQECSVIVFFAFISYTLTEEMGLSPIIALLFTGIFMSHYTFYNLSFQAREESSVVSRIMSNIAEAFVFTYLGLTVIYNASMAFSLSFFCWELIFVIIGRVSAIYGISYVIDFFKIQSFKIKNSHKGIMSCAGSIRGAIAFGLAISIDTNNRINK
jgi:NhaP-type Na+/H+ or K+/H+ antiporter